MKNYKCCCKCPNIEEWALLYRQAGGDTIVCLRCRRIWKTTAGYVSELKPMSAKISPHPSQS
ncbi:MAG: hypothetical protein Q4C04_03200 [Clostridia bacterium]|nr:hypothetical protein [Clostridia bacterium]MDO4564607.1 hypothetical protein [Clostridia bacterium]